MSNKWADGQLLEYCAQCGKEIYFENIVLDEESDDETPFCSEDCMVKFDPDGARYSLHSVLECDDETRTICFRIWDLRALSQADVAALKQKLNDIRDREKLSPAENLHPKLDWANVHAHYEDISYCVEWHDRIWPKE